MPGQVQKKKELWVYRAQRWPSLAEHVVAGCSTTSVPQQCFPHRGCAALLLHAARPHLDCFWDHALAAREIDADHQFLIVLLVPLQSALGLRLSAEQQRVQQGCHAYKKNRFMTFN